MNELNNLAIAFKYVSLAILQQRAAKITKQIGMYPVSWLTPAEVLILIEWCK